MAREVPRRGEENKVKEETLIMEMCLEETEDKDGLHFYTLIKDNF